MQNSSKDEKGLINQETIAENIRKEMLEIEKEPPEEETKSARDGYKN